MHLWVAVPCVGLAVIQNQSGIPQSVNRYVPLQQLITPKKGVFVANHLVYVSHFSNFSEKIESPIKCCQAGPEEY